MEFKLDDVIDILGRTPPTLRILLEGLPEPWARGNEGPETWSPFDVVGHLIHGERTDWIQRARIILESGDSMAFEPFDRFAQYRASRGKSLEELLETFASLRRRNLETLGGWKLTAADFSRRGLHPELGEVTLGQLLATWAVHDLNHIGQIARAMAKQYRSEVGPWKAYLGILGQ